MMRKLSYLVTAMLMVAAPACVAQSSKMPASSSFQGGMSSYTSLQGNHDSASNWSTILDQSVGYNFNKMFGMSVGVPFYLSYNQVNTSTTSTTGSTGTTTLSGSNALGDARLGLTFSSPTPLVRYMATVTGTVPTGSTSSGISTGRVTADFNNHVEFDVLNITPFGELGIANSNSLVNTYIKRPYTTLGAMPHFKGGVSIPAGKNLSFEFSGYDNLAVGAQKLYSHMFSTKTSTSTTGTSTSTKSSQTFSKGSYASGTGSIDTDNGFSTGLSTKLGKHMDLSFMYDHSVAQQLNTVAFSIGFRLGKSLPQ